MAMRATKTVIHRLTVDMSCGCKMYTEFKDAQCKEPLVSGPQPEGDTAEPEKVFISCDKHKTQDIIEFIIGERLEEAVEEAQKTPSIPAHIHAIPQGIEVGDTGGVTASSSSTVQSVMKVKRPNSVGKEPAIKTLQRSREELAKVGSVTHQGAVEMQIDEVAEDESLTPHIGELIDFLDPKNGMEDEDEGDE